MKKDRRYLLFTFFIGLSFVYFYGPTILPILTASSARAQTLIEFRASSPETHAVLGKELKIRNLEKFQQGYAVFHLNDDKPFLAAFLPPYTDKMLTLHLSIASEGNSRVGLKVNDKIVQFPWRFHHQDINLTPHLKKDRRSELYLFFETKDKPHAILEEFVLKETSTIPVFPPLGLFIIGLALFFSVYYFQKSQISSALVVAIAGLAFYFRWTMLGGAIGQPLEGDAPQYFNYAANFNHTNPWLFGKREPFFIWIQIVLGTYFGFQELTPRLLTVLLSTGNVVLCYFLFLRLSGHWGGAAIGSTLMAIGPFYVWNATRGERAELFLFLILSFCLILLAKRLKPIAKSLFLGLVAGAASLTWLIGLFGCLLSYGLMNIKNIKRWKAHLFFAFVVSIVVGPFLYANWKAAGDPFVPLNANTNFYRNIRKEGIPSHKGERRNLFKYILVEEGAKIPKQAAKGYHSLFLDPAGEMNLLSLGATHRTYKQNWFTFPFLILGIILALKRRTWGIFVLLFSFLNLSVAFIDDIFDPRLFLHATPFLAYFFGIGAAGALATIKTAVFRKNAKK